MISFKEFFNTKKTILFDGATGSNLLSEDSSASLPDLLSLKRPELVGSLHEAYFKAGCNVIETNSFNSNPISFKNFGITESAFDCAKKAAVLARKAADRFSTDEKPRFVAGSIGPIFDKRGLLQDETLLSEAFSLQISALSEGGADLLIFETMQDIIQLNSALAAAEKIRKDIPVIVSVSGKNGKTHTGTPFEEIIREMSKHDILAFGLNCEELESISEDIEIIKKISDFPLIVMPNLGLPEKIEGKFFYKTTPAEFAGKMSELIRKYDPKIVGGCCGTTPFHINALSEKIIAEKY
ncbi:homocysteine S-methyltransferase family protein [bacterium]|nr:homocysteine S-methyltransferase family protein [bacterium]